MRKSTFTDDDAEKLLEYSKQGLSKVEAAKLMGTNDRQILRILDRFNIKEEYDKNLKIATSNKNYNNIVSLYLKGLSIRMISLKLKRSEEFIAENLHKAFLDNLISSALCENSKCNKINGYSYAKGRFCCKECARSFATKDLTDEQKELRNNALRKYSIIVSEEWSKWRLAKAINPNEPYPDIFNIDFQKRNEKISKTMKWKWENDPLYYEKTIASFQNRKPYSAETRKKLSDSAKRLHKEGVLKSWEIRPKGLQSYPEKIWEEILIDNSISHKREVKVSKKELGVENDFSCYFLDYVIEVNGKKINLEIDGSQHNYPEVAERDKVRDKLLSNYGYIIYRINWVNPINDRNKKIIKSQIDDLLNFINSL